MEFELTYGQQLVWDFMNRAIADTQQASAQLEKKSLSLFSASAAIVTVFTGFNIIPSADAKPNYILATILGLFCASLVWMLWHATTLWGPLDEETFTAKDPENLYEHLIAPEPGQSYNTALYGLADIYKSAMAANQKRSNSLRWMVRVFIIQLILLVTATVVRLAI